MNITTLYTPPPKKICGHIKFVYILASICCVFYNRLIDLGYWYNVGGADDTF